MSPFPESIVEQATLDWLTQLGYTTCYASELDRQNYSDIIVTETLQTALETINPKIPFDIIQNTIKKLTRHDTPNLYENNYNFHKKVIEGIDVEYQQEGCTKYD